MATPDEVRRSLVLLTEAARADLLKAWALVGAATAEAVRDFLMEIVPAIADKYGLAAAALAADWYDEIRHEAGVAGRFMAEPAPLPDSSRFEALVRWGVDPLFRPEPDPGAAQSLISGGLGKIVTNMHGETLTASSWRDPNSYGWARRARGEGCRVCKTLAARGAVYSGATADFATHDHCHCVAVPKFGKERDVRDYERTKRFAVTEEGERRRKEANQSIKDFAADN